MPVCLCCCDAPSTGSEASYYTEQLPLPEDPGGAEDI